MYQPEMVEPHFLTLPILLRRLEHVLAEGMAEGRVWSTIAGCSCGPCQAFVACCGDAIRKGDRAACQTFIERGWLNLGGLTLASLATGQ